MDKVKSLLINKSEQLFKDNKSGVVFIEGDKQQNDFLNDLEKYPHAFVLACLMDRQINAERAWGIPYTIKEKIGSFDINELKEKGLEFYTKLFKDEKLHRFNDEMAKIFYKGICRIAEKYQGKASKIWENNPSSAAVVYRFLEFDGCGIKIATMAANILARQFKITMSDYCSIDISPDVHIKRVMWRLGFVGENSSNDLIIYKAREIYPKFPGIIDFVCWHIGRKFCRPNFTECKCKECDMNKVCQSFKVKCGA